MADRYDFYFRQLVQEDELDNPFAGLENADRALSTDLQLCRDDSNPAEFGGITYGFNASFLGLNVTHTAGKAYDEQGRRIATTTSLTVTVTNMGDTAVGQGGTPDGGSTAPAVGYERWLTLYILFDRNPTDERHDGYDEIVYFSRPESFYFHVEAGPAATIGSPLTKPARISNAILLTDVRYQNNPATGLHIAELSQARKELFFNVAATAYPNITVAQGSIRAALKDLLGHINNHVGGSAYEHPATAITYTGGTTWADGTTGSTGIATDVHMALQAIVTDLKATTDPAGAKHIGTRALTGALSTPTMAATSLTAGTLESQLATLLQALNGRIFRGGDIGLTGTFSPTTDGVAALGTLSPAKRFDAALRDVSIASLLSNLEPTSDATYNLGSTPGHRWNYVYAAHLNATDVTVASAAVTAFTTHLMPSTGTLDLGNSGSRWRSLYATDINVSVSATIAAIAATLPPQTTETYDLGTSGTRWRNVYTKDLNVSGQASISAISGDVLPSVDGTQNIGSSATQWSRTYAKSLYLNPKNYILDECNTQYVRSLRSIRDNESVPRLTATVDALGLVDNGYGYFETSFLSPFGFHTPSDFSEYFNPLSLNTIAGAPIYVTAPSNSGRWGIAITVNSIGASGALEYGTEANGIFLVSQTPAIAITYTPADVGAGSDIARLLLDIGFRATDGLEYLRIEHSTLECRLHWKDSIGVGTYVLPGVSFTLNTQYTLRLAFLSSIEAYVSIAQNGVFAASYRVTSVLFSGKAILFRFQASNNSGGTGAASALLQHLVTRTTAHTLSL